MNSVGVLLSGAGSNLNAMINNGIDVKFVVSNKQHAYGLDIAEEANIPIYCWQSLKELEEQVSKLVIQYDTKLLILAGFMRSLQQFLQQVKSADNSQAREVKLSIQQAKNLAFTIGAVMSRLEGDLERLVSQSKSNDDSEVIQVSMDGGTNWK